MCAIEHSSIPHNIPTSMGARGTRRGLPAWFERAKIVIASIIVVVSFSESYPSCPHPSLYDLIVIASSHPV